MRLRRATGWAGDGVACSAALVLIFCFSVGLAVRIFRRFAMGRIHFRLQRAACAGDAGTGGPAGAGNKNRSVRSGRGVVEVVRY